MVFFLTIPLASEPDSKQAVQAGAWAWLLGEPPCRVWVSEIAETVVHVRIGNRSQWVPVASLRAESEVSRG